jgi:hypothetical protein
MVMNAIESLASAVSHAIPAAWTRLRTPRDPKGVWWLDAKVDDHHVAVEWSPSRGFGVSASVLGDGYGEGPEETYSDADAAIARVVDLLQKRAFTRPPQAVALRELRALLGRTQVDVAGRMGVGQAAVSRLEHRDDITLGSLRRYVEALGGKLDIRVRTPAGDEVALALGVTSPARP